MLETSTLNMIIRKPIESDFDTLINFFQVVIPHTFVKAGLPADHEDVFEEIGDKKKQLDQYLKGSVVSEYLVATIDNQIVATIWYGPNGDLIKEGARGELSHLCEIGTVFVAPNFQGKGIGKFILTAMRKHLLAKGITEASLDSGYPQAQEVWCHIFGQPAYVMKDKWGPGMDHMIWKIKL